MRRVLTGVVLAALLVGVYVGGWRPMRTVLTKQVAAPALRAVDTPRAETFTVKDAGGPMVQVRDGEGNTKAGFRAPGGTLWLMPAVLLLALFPRRPYWFYLWLIHLGLGTLAVGALAVGLAWSEAGFVAHGFLRSYVLPAVSFAVPVLMWQHGKAAARASGPPPRTNDTGEVDPDAEGVRHP